MWVLIYAAVLISSVTATIFKPAVETDTLIKESGYPCETHIVQCSTFKFKIFAIPHSPLLDNQNITDKPIVFIQPGLFESSSHPALLEQKSLAFFLSNAGFIVVLSNNRGGYYAREHVHYNSINPRYWDFTYHEIGTEDIPCLVNYTLTAYKQDALHYIGHSQSNTAALVMFSKQPWMQSKFKSVIALSLYIYFEHTTSPFFNLLKVLLGNQVATAIPPGPLVRFTKQFHEFAALICREDSIIQGLCQFFMDFAFGVDRDMDKTAFELFLKVTPEAVSIYQYQHFTQMMLTNKFKEFDRGPLENIIKYGSLQPPLYDLSKIRICIHQFYSFNDPQEVVQDAEIANSMLPNAVLHGFPNKTMSHLGIWLNEHVEPLYELILKNLMAAEAANDPTTCIVV